MNFSRSSFSRNTLATLLLAATSILPVSQSNATIVDFDDAPFVGNPIVTFTASRGYDFTGDHFHTVGNPAAIGSTGGASDGTQYILEEGGTVGFPITMSRSGGGTFSLGSFDAAEAFIDPTIGFPNATLINVVGNLSGGGTVSASFALDGILDGAGGVNDFQHFVLPSTFTNLSSLVFSGSIPGVSDNAGISVDNLSVTQVPEPAPLALIALALVGFAATRKTARE